MNQKSFILLIFNLQDIISFLIMVRIKWSQTARVAQWLNSHLIIRRLRFQVKPLLLLLTGGGKWQKSLMSSFRTLCYIYSPSSINCTPAKVSYASVDHLTPTHHDQLRFYRCTFCCIYLPSYINCTPAKVSCAYVDHLTPTHHDQLRFYRCTFLICLVNLVNKL